MRKRFGRDTFSVVAAVIFNVVIIVVISAILITGVKDNFKYALRQNLIGVQNMTDMSAQIFVTEMDGRKRALRNVVDYERNREEPQSMSEFISFMNTYYTKTIYDFQIIDTDGNGYLVTRRSAYGLEPYNRDNIEIRYTREDNPYIYKICHSVSDEVDGHIQHTGEFINPVTGEKSFAFYSNVRLLDEDDDKVNTYTLMAVMKVRAQLEKINANSTYQGLEGFIVDHYGDYVVEELENTYSISNNLLTDIRKYSKDFASQKNYTEEAEITYNKDGSLKKTNVTTSADAFLSMDRGHYLSKDFNGESVLFTYSRIKGYDWYAVTYVPTSRFEIITNSNSYVSLILFCILILFAVDFSLLTLMNKSLMKSMENEKRANIAKTEFLTRITHDIQIPITGIIGFLDMAEKNSQNIEVMNELRLKMRVAAEHLYSIIGDVGEIEKLEEGRIVLEHEPFNLLGLCKEVVTICEMHTEAAGVTLVTDKGMNFVHNNLVGSPKHVRQVFLNLVMNAISHSKEGGTIYCTSEEVAYDERVVTFRFRVKDTGKGYSAEELPHVFEPFAKNMYSSQIDQNSSGLGLAITKGIIEKMGGSITVESSEGKGSTFIVTIPFEIGKEEVVDSVKQENYKEINISGTNVLLVEDGELNRDIALYILKDAGVNVCVAQNGAEAIEKFKATEEGSFDLILMDMMMPVMDGTTATRRIREIRRADAKQIPIIAMTSNMFTDEQKMAKVAGMNDYLAKPLNARELCACIAKYKVGDIG